MSSSKRTEKANWLAFEIKIRDAYSNIADAPRQFYKLRGQATLYSYTRAHSYTYTLLLKLGQATGRWRQIWCKHSGQLTMCSMLDWCHLPPLGDKVTQTSASLFHPKNQTWKKATLAHNEKHPFILLYCMIFFSLLKVVAMRPNFNLNLYFV